MELRIRDVSKTYSNGVQALKDVTLTIPAGMYSLPGSNGAGNPTLMIVDEPMTGLAPAERVRFLNLAPIA